MCVCVCLCAYCYVRHSKLGVLRVQYFSSFFFLCVIYLSQTANYESHTSHLYFDDFRFAFIFILLIARGIRLLSWAVLLEIWFVIFCDGIRRRKCVMLYNEMDSMLLLALSCSLTWLLVVLCFLTFCVRALPFWLVNKNVIIGFGAPKG